MLAVRGFKGFTLLPWSTRWIFIATCVTTIARVAEFIVIICSKHHFTGGCFSCDASYISTRRDVHNCHSWYSGQRAPIILRLLCGQKSNCTLGLVPARNFLASCFIVLLENRNPALRIYGKFYVFVCNKHTQKEAKLLSIQKPVRQIYICAFFFSGISQV